MSSRNFLVEGLDLSLLPSAATNAQILQAIRESHPASGLGMLIYQSATPDVSTYTEYVTFIWINTTTGELKYWNGTSWQLITGAASIANDTVTIDKLNVTGGTALQLIRVNAGATAFEFVNVTDLFAAGSLALDKLVVAAGAGYVVYSGSGGVWSSALLTALIDAWLAATNINIDRIVDVAGVGLPNQVAYITDTFNALVYGYADQLLRANQVNTNRLNLSAGAGKYVKVNAAGTDFEYPTSAGISAAIVKYTGVAATAPQTISTTGSLQTVLFNDDTVDPGGFVGLASNQITLASGTYLFEVSIPINRSSSNSAKIVIVLRDITGASNLATATVWHPGGAGGQTTGILKHVVSPTASNVYEIQLVTDYAIDLGVAANTLSLAETYQQLAITKLA
jgi:hypothetical protein